MFGIIPKKQQAISIFAFLETLFFYFPTFVALLYFFVSLMNFIFILHVCNGTSSSTPFTCALHLLSHVYLRFVVQYTSLIEGHIFLFLNHWT